MIVEANQTGGDEEWRPSLTRRIIRSAIERFPVVGKSYLLPKAVYLFEKAPMWPWYRRMYAAREAAKIRKAISEHGSEILLVYDCSVGPLTFGDFLNFVMIMRFIGEHGQMATFAILTSGAEHTHSKCLGSSSVREFLKSTSTLAEVLLQYPMIQVVHEDSVEGALSRCRTAEVEVVGRLRVGHRRPLFHHGFNIFNHLMSGAPESLVGEVLLDETDLRSAAPDKELPERYVTWHVRYSERVDSSRNLSPEEFLEMYALLRREYPGYWIILISDQVGIDRYRSICEENRLLRIMYSKDYSSSILGDAWMILRGECYFTLRGGGITHVPLMSRAPYRCAFEIVHEQMWDDERLTCWQGQDQKYVNETQFGAVSWSRSS